MDGVHVGRSVGVGVCVGGNHGSVNVGSGGAVRGAVSRRTRGGRVRILAGARRCGRLRRDDVGARRALGGAPTGVQRVDPATRTLVGAARVRCRIRCCPVATAVVPLRMPPQQPQRQQPAHPPSARRGRLNIILHSLHAQDCRPAHLERHQLHPALLWAVHTNGNWGYHIEEGVDHQTRRPQRQPLMLRAFADARRPATSVVEG